MGWSKWITVVLVLVVLTLQSLSVSAQTWGEFFNQKKTQQKYLFQQIAALQLYIGYAKKGYNLVSGGLNVVKDITGGEFSLHRNFFASLSAVNPSIKNSAAVSGIISSGLGIASLLKSWKYEELNVSDKAYVLLVKSSLLAECGVELEDLLLVVTAGKLELKDDERMKRLELLRLSMLDKYDFALSFTADLQQLAMQRKREMNGINEMRRWYEIE